RSPLASSTTTLIGAFDSAPSNRRSAPHTEDHPPGVSAIRSRASAVARLSCCASLEFWNAVPQLNQRLSCPPCFAQALRGDKEIRLGAPAALRRGLTHA